jgi:alkanesulfonate monooxygenase SsuD/methylene tetrahydromethanopterin reductase-like flavin-dependent oxidoreductase (luciferase family)
MVGSTSPRMATIALAHVDSWNVWWSIYGNSPEGFAAERSKMDDVARAMGRDPSTVEATCAVLVRAPGGGGRLMGSDDGTEAPAVTGDPSEIADQLRAFAAVGAVEVQLVVDPITAASIEWLGAVLADLDR